jgi:mono/diheme cytochrome c family protein
VSAIAFIAAWILLGLALFFVAMRGGPRRARESLYAQDRRQNRLIFLLIFAIYVGFGVAVPTLVLAGNHDDKKISSEDLSLTSRAEHGRELFGQYCNQCHTLAAAKTVGKVGPDFDQLRPTYPLVVDAVTNGRMRGNGTMPAGLVSGGDVRDVACFVQEATHPGQAIPQQCRGPASSSGGGGSGRGGEQSGGSPER